MASQQSSGVIDFGHGPRRPQAGIREEHTERGPARPAARTPAARRNRLARRYESIQIDGDNFDIPTYLRHSAD
jgi:hypothetical protein